MVRRLHDVGIEVFLDVVYNHSGEGNHLGPTLSLRGIDNASYYRLDANPRFYQDVTGTGNTLNLDHPRVLELVMDSLRYWATEMHVDGFRFDLCTTLARENGDYGQGSAFFDAVRQDPVMTGLKLIAEPWDLGPYGYQLGNFPPGWAEWNAQYRDTLRRFWRGDQGLVADLASRVAGSSDIFGYRGRRPWASINFITAHDGFTLQDLVSYNDKHNEANGEGNHDGNDSNLSSNCGVEGPSDDPEIVALRDRQKRNMLASLLLSLGVPMLVAGDEIGRTQRGNNNAYCQDNEISWTDWEQIRPEDEEMGRVRQLSDPFAARASGVLAPALSARRGLVRSRGQGHHLVHPVGQRGRRRGLGEPGSDVARLCPERGGRRVPDAGRSARHRRELFGDDERL